MPRAMLSFEAAGLEPIPAPTRFLLPGPPIWRDLLPTVGALNPPSSAVHALLGPAWSRPRADSTPRPSNPTTTHQQIHHAHPQGTSHGRPCPPPTPSPKPPTPKHATHP